MTKKLKLRKLTVELGRQCNLSCRHCMFGQSQNVTITEEIIETFLNNIEDVTKLYFIGGEPTLYVNKMKLFLEKALEKGIKPKYLRIVTNGKIKSKELVEFIESNKEIFVNGIRLTFSSDRFHFSCDANFTEDIFNNNMEWYKKHLSSTIEIAYNPYPAIDLVLEGNAKELDEEELKRIPIILKNTYNRIPLEFINDCYLEEGIQLCSNGNIVSGGDYSYETADNIAFGNILENNLYSMIRAWNDSYNTEKKQDEKEIIKNDLVVFQYAALLNDFRDWSKLIPFCALTNDLEGLRAIEGLCKSHKEEWDKHIKNNMIEDGRFISKVNDFEKGFEELENVIAEAKEKMLNNSIERIDFLSNIMYLINQVPKLLNEK